MPINHQNLNPEVERRWSGPLGATTSGNSQNGGKPLDLSKAGPWCLINVKRGAGQGTDSHRGAVVNAACCRRAIAAMCDGANQQINSAP